MWPVTTVAWIHHTSRAQLRFVLYPAGVWGNLAGVAPASAIFMAFYEPTKKAVQVG